jgi:hypothetical protein
VRVCHGSELGSAKYTQKPRLFATKLRDVPVRHLVGSVSAVLLRIVEHALDREPSFCHPFVFFVLVRVPFGYRDAFVRRMRVVDLATRTSLKTEV